MTDEQRARREVARRERYQRLKTQGICTRCGRSKAELNRAACSECLDKEKIRDAEREKFCKERGFCVRCRKERARPARTHCLYCASQSSYISAEYSRKNPKIMTESLKEEISRRHKKRYEMRKAAGICTRCGKRKAEKGRIRCMDCRIRQNRLHQNKKEHPDLDRSERPSYGMCYICGDPVKEGKRLCEKHYTAACEALKCAAACTDRKNHPWRQNNEILFGKRQNVLPERRYNGISL